MTSARTPTGWPPTYSRRRLLGLTVPATLLLAGCGLGLGQTEPTEASELPEASGPFPPLPGNRRVFWVSEPLGYFTPAVERAVTAPPILVYGDGRVVWSAQRPGRGTPRSYRHHRVDPLAVAQFAGRAAATGVIGKEVDFGQPGVTDLGSTAVVLDGFDGLHSASAYALDERFDELVDPPQRDRRRRLRSVITASYGLVGDAKGEPYVPDRIRVQQLSNRPDAPPAKVRWPGPAPDRFLHRGKRSALTPCGDLVGTAAATVYRAAVANPGQRWRVNGADVTLAVAPLAQGRPC